MKSTENSEPRHDEEMKYITFNTHPNVSDGNFWIDLGFCENKYIGLDDLKMMQIRVRRNSSVIIIKSIAKPSGSI